jgi:hypothetical protein
MPSRLAVRLASILSPISPDMLRLRPDEMHFVLAEDFGKARILREETVAGMHRVGAGDLAGGEQRRNVEIAVARRRRPDADAFLASRTCMASASAVECTATVAMPSSLQARSTRSAISPRLAIRILSNMLEPPACAGRVGYCHSMIIIGSPNSTGRPSSIRIWITVPRAAPGSGSSSSSPR